MFKVQLENSMLEGRQLNAEFNIKVANNCSVDDCVNNSNSIPVLSDNNKHYSLSGKYFISNSYNYSRLTIAKSYLHDL